MRRVNGKGASNGMLPLFFLLKYQEERAEARDTPAVSVVKKNSSQSNSKGDLGQGSKGSLESGFKRS